MTTNKKALRPYSTLKTASAPALEGVWQNELGSTMTITGFDGRTFGGSYTSAVSSGHSPVTGTLTGTLAGDAIAFMVNWSPAFSSVTSWNGLLLADDDSLSIYSLWHLASTPESEDDFWQSIMAGADLFVQIEP
jgi:hypothetical protein